MIAIVEHGSHQFKVETGSIIDIDWMQQVDTDATPDTIIFNKVLLLSDQAANTRIGSPYISGVSVQATVLEPCHKDEKITVFKFKTKTGYKVKQGHRQKYTRVKITSINTGDTGNGA